MSPVLSVGRSLAEDLRTYKLLSPWREFEPGACRILSSQTRCVWVSRLDQSRVADGRSGICPRNSPHPCSLSPLFRPFWLRNKVCVPRFPMQCIAFDSHKHYTWALVQDKAGKVLGCSPSGHEPDALVPAEPEVPPRARRACEAQLTDHSSLLLLPSLINVCCRFANRALSQASPELPQGAGTRQSAFPDCFSAILPVCLAGCGHSSSLRASSSWAKDTS